MSESNETTCQEHGCKCGAPAVEGGCCCGSTCLCGLDCQCPASCGCPGA